ncbi:DUF6879 family protein [Actinokineospora fastidiosa]|uniref:DUF6879 domain-containing protein n=1 Tax=Actinokineospora fastidiosa TaxID=1816 RepID=A0A918LEW2_9PSEU|nr:DUF6879 family protein [Actinokineospora fastidiosa]GGS37055.1 hypothetical protein GCM10010171_34890 [Actinokineospora fastidiosa]
MTGLVTGDGFAELFRTFTRSAFRWEARPAYCEDYEAEPLRKWRAGEPDDLAWMAGWLDGIRAAAAEGRRFERVRLYTVPPTEYLRWQQHVTPANVEAGEDIRVITEGQARALGLPEHDFWLFDGRLVARMHFGDDGRWRGAELINETDTVARHRAWRDLAWEHATPYPQYRDRHFARSP